MENECNGGFLFISHSHKDMDKVRQLRNKLEDKGYEPLCFYLKALDDSEEELDDLIKREIDAREWFIYANSIYARESEWVHKECEWRKREESKNKHVWVVELDSDLSIDEISETLSLGLRVNIIHDDKDIDFVDKLTCKLRQRDLQVISNRNLKVENREEQLIENIKTSAITLLILSQNSNSSDMMIQDTMIAAQSESFIIPVYIDDIELNLFFKLHFMNIQGIMPEKQIKDENDFDNFVDKVVDEIRRSLDKYFK